MGDVICPVVPVFIGTTVTGGVASGLIARSGPTAHLVEQRAVASDAARFRLQAMADPTAEDADLAVDILDTCIRKAKESLWRSPTATDRAPAKPPRRTDYDGPDGR
jgi:glycine C-acetyltransferase